MSFPNLAKQIIKDSIISTVYIDDHVVEPFEARSEKNSSYFDVSSGLYQSFKQENKSIDFYRFSKANDLEKDYDYIFKNRDLLILDWHLDDPTSLRQPSTMEFLRKAVNTDNLHFVSIYTQSDERDFDEIFYSIKAYFEIGFNDETKSICEAAFQEIEEKTGIDSIKFFNSLSSEFKQITIDPTKSDVIFKELKVTIETNLGEAYPVFSKFIRNIAPNKDIKRACEILGYYINNEDVGLIKPFEHSFKYDFIGDNFIVINHTIIQITNKNKHDPINHFNFFTNALLKVCGNLLTLTSLEIRNLLRASSGFIGKDADSINEAALFYHKTRKENFFDFIVSIWKSHTFSYVDYNSHKLISLNNEFWKEYEVTNTLPDKLTVLMEKENEELFHKELSKLNTYYNTLHVSKDKDEKIRFGDVFICTEGNHKNDIFLNITAHCDCEEPKANIKNNFYFLIGKKSKLEEELKMKEEGFNSYLKLENNELIAIKWGSRPVILNIPQNKMANFIVNTKDGLQKDIPLKYIGTLKENYTQRMANNSFAFAMRVGIDYATI